MKRSEEIKQAIKIKEQAKRLWLAEFRGRKAELDRDIVLLTAELEAIKNGKRPDHTITL